MSQPRPRKIIIDTDPGQDDAFAILMALASPDEIDVLGICAVAGNVPLNWTERNARIICELFREPDAQLGFLWGGMTMGMLLSVPLMLTGFALMAAALKRPPLRA